MNTKIFYDNNVGGGWYCSNCGEFVPLNTNHQCPSLSEATGNYYGYAHPYPSDRDLLLKIIEKLDKIIEVLANK